MFLQKYSVESNLTFSTFTLGKCSYTTSNLLFLSKILPETPGAVFLKKIDNWLEMFQNNIYYKPSNFFKQILFFSVTYYRANCRGARRIETGIVIICAKVSWPWVFFIFLCKYAEFKINLPLFGI